ncbi:hypothetical protein ACJJI4_01125 [Microbulbifer sp. TRSA002]|uniref:hypothetical protein n=1 Tax=Microbulbifer sp. TRSA002 TaxID=3243382 RepID=UPI0040392737
MMEEVKSLEVLQKITKIIETRHVGDANGLLRHGFVLMGVSEHSDEDSATRFLYTLGFPKPLSELSHWVEANF